MTNGNYMMHSEISQVADLLTALNQIGKGKPGSERVSVGAFPVYDSNGEIVGWIAMCESTEYALYPGDKNPEKE